MVHDPRFPGFPPSDPGKGPKKLLKLSALYLEYVLCSLAFCGIFNIGLKLPFGKRANLLLSRRTDLFQPTKAKTGVSTLNSIADVWNSVLQQLRSELSETTIRTWFDEITPLDLRDATLYLYCPRDVKRGYLQSLLLKNIEASLKDIFSADIRVKLLDKEGCRAFLGGEPSRN